LRYAKHALNGGLSAIAAAAAMWLISVDRGSLAQSELVSGCPDPSVQPSSVEVAGRDLVVRKRLADGTLGAPESYIIRGVNWSPASATTATTPADPNNANVRRPEFGIWYATDVPLMAAANVNTVRLFIDPGFEPSLGTQGLAILDALYAQDVMVIMTVDDAINDTARAVQVVSHYRCHPAILMWSVGSEWNINRYFGVATSVQDAVQRTEHAVRTIKQADPDHLVASSYGEINIDANSMRLADTARYVNREIQSVDIWALNIYRGNNFGDLFDQWASISSKPMFLGEFGTDAYFEAKCPHEDPDRQADWNGKLWDDVLRDSLSVEGASVGGTLFEWNDEWWKVPPFDSQQTGGFNFPGAHADNVANEEFFGLVEIDRTLRPAALEIATAFVPSYVPASDLDTLFRSESRGGLAEVCFFHFGGARFLKNDVVFYDEIGGGGLGRGFSFAVIDAASGKLVETKQFDTWLTRSTGTAMNAMVAYIDDIQNGRLVMVSVGDDAGLTLDNSCTAFANSWTLAGVAALQSLGSQLIDEYCFRGSWAMVTVKGNVDGQGNPVALSEDLARDELAAAEASFIVDRDADGVADADDNCPTAPNADQANLDGDRLGEACDVLDSDADGCSDVEEAQTSVTFGGERDRLDTWDFFDVTGDAAIDLQDALAILDRFGALPGEAEYDPLFDRYAPDAAKPWRTAAAVGEHVGIDLQDALVNLQSFGHSCAGAP
jgi:hypothetical protein